MSCKSNSSKNMGGGVACVYELEAIVGQRSGQIEKVTKKNNFEIIK